MILIFERIYNEPSGKDDQFLNCILWRLYFALIVAFPNKYETRKYLTIGILFTIKDFKITFKRNNKVSEKMWKRTCYMSSFLFLEITPYNIFKLTFYKKEGTLEDEIL